MIKNRSLIFKLILFFAGSCSFLFEIIFAYNYQFSRHMIMAGVEENARNLTLRTVNRIEGVVLSVQKVPENIAYFLENGASDQQQMLGMLRMVTQENNEIYGTAIMFEPYAFKKNLLYYDPYYYKVGRELKFTNTPDYFLDDFYQIPKELNAPVWSEPYVDEDAKALMATYSVPFYGMVNGERKLKGIVSADISLQWLTDVVASIKVLKTGDAFLISRNGTIISDPVKDFIMNESIFSVAEARGDNKLREIGRKMTRGESGFVKFTSLALHKKCWMCYAPIPSTGWSLGVIFPEKEFMEGVTKLNRVVAALAVSGMIILVIVFDFIAHSITRPLRAMARAAVSIGAGNMDTEIPTVDTGDEVGKLAKAFKEMQSSLKKYIKDLQETTASKERIESELKIAHEIQSGMLPRIFPPFPDRKEIDLYATMEPAKEVGGDFYDFFFTAENKLFFLIGDVSGKGVPAALFMMITKILMKTEALKGVAPDEVLSRTNNIIAMDNDSSMFATIFCGVLDTQTGEVECSNAGHNPPVLCRKGAPCEFLKLNHGFVLGPMTGTKFTLQKLKLAPGDMLFIYTDGVTEAMNPQKQLFSEKKLLEVLEGLKDVDATGHIHALHDEVKRYAQDEPQSDDITMLALKYKGNS